MRRPAWTPGATCSMRWLNSVIITPETWNASAGAVLDHGNQSQPRTTFFARRFTLTFICWAEARNLHQALSASNFKPLAICTTPAYIAGLLLQAIPTG